MTVNTTLPALLGTGVHAARPAANTIGPGGLYACTDHSLIYQTNGTTWSTWATVGGGGGGGAHPDLATHDALGLATDAELAAVAAAGAHPNLAAHDALGLATQAELDAVAAGALTDPTTTTGDMIYLAGADNVALSKTATSSSVGDSCTPDLAVNGVSTGSEVPLNSYNAGTRIGWRSNPNTAGEWLQVDLGSAMTIGRVIATFSAMGNRKFQSHQLQWSTNTSSWTTVYTQSAYVPVEDRTFTPVLARYWRVLCGPTDGYGGDIVELQLLTASALARTPSTSFGRTALNSAAALQSTAEKGVANGYAGLGSGGRVPMAQLASGTPDGAKFVRDDGTLAVPAGGGGGTAGSATEYLPAGDVSVANGTYSDVVSATLDPGTYVLIGSFLFQNGGSTQTLTGRLYDGTASLASKSITMTSSGYAWTLELFAVVSPTVVTTYKLQASAGSAGVTAHKDNAYRSGEAKSTKLIAHKVGGGGPAILPSARVKRTAGQITLNSTAWANVDTSLDITVTAAVGDVLDIQVQGLLANTAVAVGLDAVTVVGGSPVNSVSASAAGDYGFYYGPLSQESVVSANLQYVVQSGDVSAGTVTLRLRYKTSSATNRILYAGTGGSPQFNWSVFNLTAPSGGSAVVDTGWKYVGAAGQPAFETSWVNYGAYGDCGFRRIGKVVYLAGLVKSGSTSGNIFTLPVGYRPTATSGMGGSAFLFGVNSNMTMGRVDIYPGGAVQANGVSNTWVTLNGISFITDDAAP